MVDNLQKAMRLIFTVIKSNDINETTKDELIAINKTLKDITDELK